MPTSELMPETISREITTGAQSSEDKAPEDKGFDKRPKLSMLEHGRIEPSPLNPRKHFDEAGLQELADSIAAHGIQQPIVVRQHNESRGPLGGNDITYSIVIGERRWRAAALAGMATVPAIVRTDLDDLKHAELAMEENIRRRDLTVMEEASGYAKLMELGKTQAEIGEGVGVKQARISSIISLLKLPGDVQQMIDTGKLTAGHGIALARYKAWPEVCSFLAGRIVRDNLPVSQAERGLSSFSIHGHSGEVTDPVIKLSGYPYPAFDWKAICPTCPFGAYYKDGSNQQGEHFYCMKPSHAANLETSAKETKRKEAEAEAEKLRKQAVERSRKAEEAAQAATTKTATAQAQAEVDAARRAQAAMTTETGKPKLSKTQYGVIEEIYGSAPAECHAGTCPCRCMAIQQHSESIVPACADPKRQANLKATAQKDKNKERRVIFDDLRRQLSEVPWGRELGAARAQRALAMLAWSFLKNCKKDARRSVAERLPAEHQPVRDLLLRTGYEIPEADAHTALAAMTTTDLLCLTAEIYLRDELISRYDYDKSDSPNTTWFLSPVSPDIPAKTEPVETEADGAMLCEECGEPLTDGAFDEASLQKWKTGGALRMSSGELAVRGATWCHQCGPQRDDDGCRLPDTEPADTESDSDNEAALCGCGEPTCLGTCAAPEPWAADRDEAAAGQSQ